MDSSLCFFDSFGVVFVLLTVFIFFGCVLSSLFDIISVGLFRLFCFFLVVSCSFLCFCFLFYSLFGFYLLFEFVFLVFFIVLVGWGYRPERLQASFYMLFYTILVSFPFLCFIFFLFYNSFVMFFGFSSFFDVGFVWVFCLLVFFVKVPVYYVHLWLPKAHVEAPLVGSIILAGVLLKLGMYGVFRVSYYCVFSLFSYGLYFFCFLLLGGFISGLVCFRQVDLKSLVAYSSVCHIGLCVGGLFSFCGIRLIGRIMVVVRHGFVSSCLFLILFVLYCRVGSRRVFVGRGVLWSGSVYSLWWFIFCFLNIRLPPTLGFWGELFLLMGSFSVDFMVFFFILVLLLVVGFYGVFMFFGVSHGGGFLFSSYVNIYVREYLLFFFHFVPRVFLGLLMWVFFWWY